MRKLLLALFLFLILPALGHSQGFTPPTFVIGATADGLFAVHDAYGTDFNAVNSTYGMMWGRGASIYGKFGLGMRGNHKITLSAGYSKFINSGASGKTFFEQNPKSGLQTNYNIWTGSLGYEYTFNARCRNKQFVGLAASVNLINAQPGAIDFDNALRFGLIGSAGYEIVLDRNFNYGLLFMFKYHLMNIFGQENGVRKMNDGSGSPGPGWWRRVGSISLHIGFNFYFGTKQIKPPGL